jgi:sec-independent protein translocase protein TatC
VEERQTFIEHLEELRKRLIISLIAIGIGFFICYIFSEKIFRLLMMPLQKALPPGATMIFTTPAEAFFTYIKVGLFAGIVAASPIILYQIWLFVAPALHSHEKKYVIPFVTFSTLIFIGGAAFGYFVAFPFIFKFLMGYATDVIQPAPRLKESLTFCSALLLVFGLIFELPLFIFLLAKLGVVDAQMLARNRKFAIIAIFILAVILPPLDVASQLIIAAPLIVLYEASIWLVRVFGRKPKPGEQKQSAKSKKKK